MFAIFFLDFLSVKDYQMLIMIKLNREEIRTIGAKAEVDDRTVERVYEGKPSRGLGYERVRKAAEKLGLAPPPPQKKVSKRNPS